LSPVAASGFAACVRAIDNPLLILDFSRLPINTLKCGLAMPAFQIDPQRFKFCIHKSRHVYLRHLTGWSIRLRFTQRLTASVKHHLSACAVRMCCDTQWGLASRTKQASSIPARRRPNTASQCSCTLGIPIFLRRGQMGVVHAAPRHLSRASCNFCRHILVVWSCLLQ